VEQIQILLNLAVVVPAVLQVTQQAALVPKDIMVELADRMVVVQTTVVAVAVELAVMVLLADSTLQEQEDLELPIVQLVNRMVAVVVVDHMVVVEQQEDLAVAVMVIHIVQQTQA